VNVDGIFAGLNAEQRRAVEAVRGPVCILAGAGSGKTTTITHRVANQVASGAFAPSQILAVTFTDKAAGEMRSRLELLGVTGVRASTFHSAALSQLRYFRPDAVGKILASKTLLVYNLVRRLPAPFKFRAAGDFATEIEWARNRRIPPSRYRDSLDGHAPPVPDDVMHRVYEQYELVKREQGLMDFEDLLERAIATFEDDHAVAEFRDRYAALTVDEYQDVNLLQQTLLDRWLGDREELCAVGDDYQSIYAFTGATPAYLLGLPSRFSNTTVIRLEDNYRSSPEVLALADRIVPALGGAEKILRATLGSGTRRRSRVRRGTRAVVAQGRRAARGDRDPLSHKREAGRLRRAAARCEDRLPRCVFARARGRTSAATAPAAGGVGRGRRLGTGVRQRGGLARAAAGDAR
jgi:DNA helicase-2/ATP-dependent DNA helicase PcrA